MERQKRAILKKSNLVIIDRVSAQRERAEWRRVSMHVRTTFTGEGDRFAEKSENPPPTRCLDDRKSSRGEAPRRFKACESKPDLGALDLAITPKASRCLPSILLERRIMPSSSATSAETVQASVKTSRTARQTCQANGHGAYGLAS